MIAPPFQALLCSSLLLGLVNAFAACSSRTLSNIGFVLKLSSSDSGLSPVGFTVVILRFPIFDKPFALLISLNNAKRAGLGISVFKCNFFVLF